MNFFKTYLPSNASHTLYPNNMPTDYRIRFDNPIELDGKWEVGVESIVYSPHIDDEDEKASIDIDLHVRKTTTVNSKRWFQYKLNEDNTWPGFDGVEPDLFEPNSHNVNGVMETLNNFGQQLVTSTERDFPIFHFRMSDSDQVAYFPIDKSLTVLLTRKLAKVLGFGYEVVLGGKVASFARFPRQVDIRLTKEDYHIKFFSSNVLKRVDRLPLFPRSCRGLKTEEEFFRAFCQHVE